MSKKFSQLAPTATLGVPRLYRYDFAFDTPGLDAGVEVLTPAVGDMILDASFWVTETFDGTTPLADIGIANGFQDHDHVGIFGAWGATTDAGDEGPVDLSFDWTTPVQGSDTDHTATGAALKAPWGRADLRANWLTYNLTRSFYVNEPGGVGWSGVSPNSYSYMQAYSPNFFGFMQRWLVSEPLLLWATQDGLRGGTPLDSTAGAGFLLLVAATPAPLS